MLLLYPLLLLCGGPLKMSWGAFFCHPEALLGGAGVVPVGSNHSPEARTKRPTSRINRPGRPDQAAREPAQQTEGAGSNDRVVVGEGGGA